MEDKFKSMRDLGRQMAICSSAMGRFVLANTYHQIEHRQKVEAEMKRVSMSTGLSEKELVDIIITLPVGTIEGLQLIERASLYGTTEDDFDS